MDRRRLLRLITTATGTGLLPVSALTAAAQVHGGHRRVDPAMLRTTQQLATHLASSYDATPSQEAVGAAQADAWFTEALRLARDAADRRLEAYALASSACVPLYNPEPDRAAVLAALGAAAELARLLPPSGQAFLFSCLAREHAARGDDLSSGRFLERARAAAARAQGGDPGWGWWSAHGGLDIRPDVFEGTRSLLLGRPAEALRVFDATIDVTGDPPYYRLTHRWRVMEACAALGDPDRACASAHAGLDEVDTYGLGPSPQEIRKARLAFPEEWATLGPVIELDERLALAS